MVQATSDFINPRFILSKFVEYRYKKSNPQKYFKSPGILITIVKKL